MSFKSVALTKRQESQQVLNEGQVRVLLEGLPRYSVAAFLKLGLPMCMPQELGGSVLDGRVWLPPAPGQEPELHDVIGYDLGKFQFKAMGVGAEHYLIDTCIIDAHCKAQDVKHETGVRRSIGVGSNSPITGKDTWQLLSVDGQEQYLDPYWVGDDALTKTGNFTQGSIRVRCVEQRFRQLYCTGLATQLEAIGHSFYPIKPLSDQDLKGAGVTEPETADPNTREKWALEHALTEVPTHYVIISFGVPYEDLVPEIKKETGKALRSLPQEFIVMRINTLSGARELCKIHVSDIYAYEQTRGTDEALFTRPDGESAQDAISAKSLARTYIDIGGGDQQKNYVADDGSVLSFQGDFLGKGTIVLARALIPVVKKNHGVTLTEIQAQRALYTRLIRGRGGRDIDISADIDSLSEFDDILARIEITDEMLATLVVFTGGGSALLHNRIKKKMMQLVIQPPLQEGNDYIAVPEDICTILNVAGLTLRGIFKAQGIEIDFNRAYLADLLNQFNTFLRQIEMARWDLHREVDSVIQQLYKLQAPGGFEQVRWPTLKNYKDRLQELQKQSVVVK